MNVIFTIDTEGHKGIDPVAHLIYGSTTEGNYGIDKLMDICEKYQVKGLFFVDVAEAWHYGKEKMAGVLRHIRERGHDIGVHVHPDHMADKTRLFLAEYTKEEQYEILSKCTDFYEKILGEPPKSFRAGKYGANWETLNILSKLGYVIDFSEFYGQKWCCIDPPCAYSKITKLENGLLEVPVSSYKSFSFMKYSRTDKVDINMPYAEYKHILEKNAETKNFSPVVLFAHSFSLLDWRAAPNEPTPKQHACLKVEKMFSYIQKSKEYSFISLENLLKQDYKNENDTIADYSKGLSPFVYFGMRAASVMKMKIDIMRQKM